jgi:molecular chaperone DnaK (HSP70)
MNTPDSPPIWRPLPTKLRAYEALYWLNRSFEAALLSLERLERLGMFRPEYLNEYKIRLEHTRAQANEELIDTLHEREMDDSARFDRMEREWENRRKDPDDVFFHARDRRQQIKEQIKELQEALNRQHARPKGATRKKRRG